jgi:uncharacterized protein (DUF983 family)
LVGRQQLSAQGTPDPARRPVSVWRAGLLCRCPRCGEGKLYSGILQVAERCTVCGLSLKEQDAGDGPAVFVMFLVGAIVVVLAIVLEFTVEPPYWVHVVLWVPLIVGLCALLLRPAKAILIAQQYKNRVQGFGDSD